MGMACPYSIYGCNFECRIRDMENHCNLNELQHVKLKLNYLENQLFVPEIISLHGMKGFNDEYIECNGKYLLHHNKQKQNALQPIVYRKNGGYTLEFNQNESMWFLRSSYFGLIAYGMPKQSVSGKQLCNFMNDSIVWSVYTEHGVKDSLIIDQNVWIEPLSLSDGMLKWNFNEETDTEEINGELEHKQSYQEQQVFDVEGVVVVNENKNMMHRKNSSLYDFVFGVEEKQNKKRVTKKRMEMVGIVALTGIAVYYLWTKFGKSHPMPTVNVLQTRNGILTPSQLLKW